MPRTNSSPDQPATGTAAEPVTHGRQQIRCDGGSDTSPPPDADEPSTAADEVNTQESLRASRTMDPRDRLARFVERLPLAAGSFIGATALLIPYIAITAVTSVAANRGNALAVAADMFFTIVTFGAGERFVNGFVSVAAVSSLRNVRPSDYPSIEAELEASLSLLQAEPEAAILLLYVAGPWILYLGGRYLSRHYAMAETEGAFALAGATVATGTFPVLVVLGIVFQPPDLVRAVLFFGLVLPAVIGAIGGLSVYAFRHERTALSKGIGWLGVGVAILVSFVLSPWLPLSLDLAQRAAVAGMGVLAATSLTIEPTPVTVLIFLAAAAAAVLAGYARAWLARDAVDTRVDGVRLGASVVLGYLGAVVLLGAVLPLSRILLGVPVEAVATFATAQPDVASYLRIVLVGGVLFPLVCCSLGGYLGARSIEAGASDRL